MQIKASFAMKSVLSTIKNSQAYSLQTDSSYSFYRTNEEIGKWFLIFCKLLNDNDYDIRDVLYFVFRH